MFLSPDCFEIANLLCEEFRKEKAFGHIELCYTDVCIHAFSAAGCIFHAAAMTDCPRTKAEARSRYENLILYEPNAEEVFDAIVPEYLAGLVYGGVCESTGQ